MRRRLTLLLPIPLGYAAWIAWACAVVARDAAAMAANPKLLAFVACNNGWSAWDAWRDVPSANCIKLLKAAAESTDELTLWTALWRLRAIYAEWILVPPSRLVTMIGVVAVVWYGGLVARHLVGRRRQCRQDASHAWRAARAWPFRAG